MEFAANYITFDLKNPSAVVNTVQGIRKQINKLQNFSERNELDDNSVLVNLGIRMDYCKNYKIYYVVKNDEIIIVKRISNSLVAFDGTSYVLIVVHGIFVFFKRTRKDVLDAL